ncbi:MAG: hypothetical protein N3B13_06570 [Deltaproteobacteria bacterium]|nr:hypothetical protein [Deltaproteobacteria bacterium]
MKKMILILAFFCVSLSAGAEQISRSLMLDLNLDNFMYYKNDSDFDNSKRKYQPQGNSEGILATYLNSQMTLSITNDVFIFYETELGTNIWSKNNPDISDPLSEDIFILKHRQLYGSAEFFGNQARIRSGYIRITDPTGLFINHWIGAFQLGFDVSGTKNFVTIAQIPDFNYEGLTSDTNNFANDRWLFALSSSFGITGKDILTLGWYSYYDDTMINRSNLIHSPLLSYIYNNDSLKVILDLILQFGVMQNAAIGGEDIKEISYGANLNISERIAGLNLILNGLYLSADDRYSGNTFNGGFYYSGKNRSATVMLSEDEMRDQYNNVDERLSVKDGPFYIMRAGLFLFDIKAEYLELGIIVPSVILGTAFVSESKNANNSSFAGFEADLSLKLDISRGWDITGLFGVLFPGKAASSYINMYDINSTDTQYLGQVHINYRY